MALNKESGFVWTAFLIPISFAALVATQVEQHGEYEIQLEELSDSVVEIRATGGRYNQWFTRGRIMMAGYFLSHVTGFPALNVVDPEPIVIWLPFAGLLVVAALMVLGCSGRRRVLTAERQFVTDYLLLGRRCWWRRRWQVS